VTETSWLDREIHWHRADDARPQWQASYDGRALRLRRSDERDERRYTLVVDDAEELCLVSPWPERWIRTVVLRDQHDEEQHRSLWAFLEPNGNFVIDGQDLGPSVEGFFGKGIREYEWKRTVLAAEVPRLLELLGARAGTDPLEALEAWLRAHDPSRLERLIEAHDFTRIFWSRAGD
jgi:hypothetical protein